MRLFEQLLGAANQWSCYEIEALVWEGGQPNN